MNIYEKIQCVKNKLLETNIKKTGVNKYAGYNYYELADFTPYIVKFCDEVKLFTAISFDKEFAKLTIINSEKPDERIEYTSPIEELELKGCNKIQALGGVETYSRRYLYMSAFDIIESDMFDGVNGKEQKEDIGDKLIDNTKIEALKMAAKNKGLTEEQLVRGLAHWNYKSLEEIKEKDYMAIYQALCK